MLYDFKGNFDFSSPFRNQKTEIVVVSTGGTIEKIYDEGEGSLENKESYLQKALSRLRLPYTSCLVYPLFAKDSLYMTEQDRETIAQFIAPFVLQGKPILIVHGTDTLHLTANYLCQSYSSAGTQLKAPLVLTGAMRPLDMENSDGLQNLAESLWACKYSPPAIFLSFHNQLFLAPYFEKNKQKLTFEGKI